MRGMKPTAELSEELRAALDEIPVWQLAEYLCQRVGLQEGEKMLQLRFVAGRYERMQRFAAAGPG